MSRKLAPIAFIITLVLLMTSILPGQASASSDLSLLWKKEFNGSFYNETAKTSTNGTLLTTYEFTDDVNFNRVYNFDFMKLDSAGNIVSSKKLKSGQVKIFNYEDQGYIAFISQRTKKFELYNEDFELVLSKTIPFKKDVSLEIKGDVIALKTGSLYYDKDSSEAVFYSLKTLEEIKRIDIPIDRYIGLSTYDFGNEKETYSIAGITFADTIVEEIPIDLEQFNGIQPYRSNENLRKINGYFYAALDVRERKEYYEDSVELLKFDLQGNIVERHKVADENGVADSAVIMNDKIIVQSDKYYEYDLESLKLTKSISAENAYPDLWKVTSDLYYYSVGKELIFANSDGDIKYKKADLNYLLHNSNKYFVGITSDWKSVVYSIETGEKVLEDPDSFLVVHDDRVFAYYNEYNPEAEDMHTSIIKLYGEKVEEPISETVKSDKMWTITFNGNVDKDSVSVDSIYILDKFGEKVTGVTFKTIDEKVEVNAPAAGYTSGETFILYVTSAVQSIEEIVLKEEASKEFTIE